MKIYTIRDDYIDFLRSLDPNVLYNKKEKRPYIGIVIVVNQCNYYVPLSSPKPKHKTMRNGKDFIKLAGGTCGVINFNNMIPVIDSVLTLKDIANEQNPSYKALLMKQTKEINAIESKIKDKAQNLHNLVMTEDSLLNPYDLKVKKRCCNFALLEERHKDFK